MKFKNSISENQVLPSKNILNLRIVFFVLVFKEFKED